MRKPVVDAVLSRGRTPDISDANGKWIVHLDILVYPTPRVSPIEFKIQKMIEELVIIDQPAPHRGIPITHPSGEGLFRSPLNISEITGPIFKFQINVIN